MPALTPAIAALAGEVVAPPVVTPGEGGVTLVHAQPESLRAWVVYRAEGDACGATSLARGICFDPRPRAEGDAPAVPRLLWLAWFRPTPSRGGRPGIAPRCLVLRNVSTHALARRATSIRSERVLRTRCFDPRPRAEGDFPHRQPHAVACIEPLALLVMRLTFVLFDCGVMFENVFVAENITKNAGDLVDDGCKRDGIDDPPVAIFGRVVERKAERR